MELPIKKCVGPGRPRIAYVTRFEIRVLCETSSRYFHQFISIQVICDSPYIKLLVCLLCECENNDFTFWFIISYTAHNIIRKYWNPGESWFKKTFFMEENAFYWVKKRRNKIWKMQYMHVKVFINNLVYKKTYWSRCIKIFSLQFNK